MHYYIIWKTVGNCHEKEYTVPFIREQVTNGTVRLQCCTIAPQADIIVADVAEIWGAPHTACVDAARGCHVATQLLPYREGNLFLASPTTYL